ncbi:MAG TPA: hypothetical protein PKA19_15890 [Bacillota bacterium]|nr:hypothetical protein [Bacillota bacterium]
MRSGEKSLSPSVSRALLPRSSISAILRFTQGSRAARQNTAM